MPVPELSLTEERIVRLLAEGLAKGEIAEAVGLDERTVDWHAGRAGRKLERRRPSTSGPRGGSSEASDDDERKEWTYAQSPNTHPHGCGLAPRGCGLGPCRCRFRSIGIAAQPPKPTLPRDEGMLGVRGIGSFCKITS